MKIIVDVFGGDNAPLEILKGCALAKDELNVDLLLCGSEAAIRKCAADNAVNIEGMQIKDAPDIMTMHDNPKDILKAKGNTSMAIGLKALANGEGDAFVSAGSTGALVVGATFLVKRIKGIRRAALASIMPSNGGPFMLIDCGANVDCQPDALVAFGLMGDIYMSRVMGIEKPRIALANIGAEETKGAALQVEAHKLMKQSSYNFTGNIEAREIPYGGADVVVCDGFTGNVILKLYEGLGTALMQNIKQVFKKNAITKLSALAVKGGLQEFKAKMDYTEFGGAPLMGISKPVIKAHGSSNAKAFKNAIRQAVVYSRQNVIATITQSLPKTNRELSDE